MALAQSVPVPEAGLATWPDHDHRGHAPAGIPPPVFARSPGSQIALAASWLTTAFAVLLIAVAAYSLIRSVPGLVLPQAVGSHEPMVTLTADQRLWPLRLA